MLNKITTIACIKSEIEKGETDNGKTYHKIFCTSKCSSGKGYIPYNFTLWGNRFDGVVQYMEKDKFVYIEADLQELKPYINQKGEPSVVMQGYISKIELLPRESKKEQTEKNEEPTEESTVTVEQELPF